MLHVRFPEEASLPQMCARRMQGQPKFKEVRPRLERLRGGRIGSQLGCWGPNLECLWATERNQHHGDTPPKRSLLRASCQRAVRSRDLDQVLSWLAVDAALDNGIKRLRADDVACFGAQNHALSTNLGFAFVAQCGEVRLLFLTQPRARRATLGWGRVVLCDGKRIEKHGSSYFSRCLEVGDMIDSQHKSVGVVDVGVVPKPGQKPRILCFANSRILLFPGAPSSTGGGRTSVDR